MGNAKTDPVVVARVGTLGEADVMRASLEAAGVPAFIRNENVANVFSHMGPAVHPWGVEVAVHPSDVGQARDILHLAPVERRRQRKEFTPEESAASAAWLGLFFFWFPPICLVVGYYIVRAMNGSRQHSLQRPLKFRLSLLAAALLGIAIPLVLLGQLIGIW